MSRIEARQLMKFFVIETPTGLINDSNSSFTLSQTPLENDAVLLWKNGVIQRPTDDYSLSGVNITFVNPPASGSDLRAFYIRKLGE